MTNTANINIIGMIQYAAYDINPYPDEILTDKKDIELETIYTLEGHYSPTICLKIFGYNCVNGEPTAYSCAVSNYRQIFFGTIQPTIEKAVSAMVKSTSCNFNWKRYTKIAHSACFIHKH